jgi:hypothetical protein
MINVQTATTAELVAFYNAHANKPVNKFADRKTAERRVNELMAGIKFSKPSAKKAAALADKPAAAPKAAPTNPDRGAAIAASWQDKAVAQARATRNGVRVKAPNGGEGNYKSVREAFVILALPLGQHIKFRGNLKAAGAAEFQGYKFKLL